MSHDVRIIVLTITITRSCYHAPIGSYSWSNAMEEVP